MSNDVASVRASLSDTPIGKISEVKLAGSGHTSNAYKVTCESGHYIALSQKGDAIGGTNYALQYAILKSLETTEYKYSPKAIYLNPDQSVILMSLIPGEPISWLNDGPEDQQKQVVEKLINAVIDIRKASYQQCADLYKEVSGKDLQPTTVQNNIQTYVVDWFKLAQDGKPNPELIEWMRPKVLACQEFSKRSVPGKNKFLVHGDSSEGNLFVTRNLQLSLIDWDTSRFNQYPDGWEDYCLGYLLNHVALIRKFKQHAVSIICEREGISRDQLEVAIHRCQELVKFGDIQWAIMMNSRVAAGEIAGDPDHYLQIARQRIAEYERDFADNSFLV